MQPDATLANPTILKGLVAAPRAWHGPDLVEDDFKILLTGDCIAELETIIAEQRKAPVPTLVLQPEHFKMDACRKLMQGAKQRLDGGLGFVIFDRLPVDRWRKQEVIDVYWLLGSLLETPVAQEWKGSMIYDGR